MKRLLTALLGCGAAGLAGCAGLHSNLSHPNVDIPPSYTAPDETLLKSTANESATKRWWTLFGSSTLDALVEQALSGSQTLASARARLTAEQETLRAARSARYPEIVFSPQVAREKQSAASFGLTGQLLTIAPEFQSLSARGGREL